jgi:hypothetical protein
MEIPKGGILRGEAHYSMRVMYQSRDWVVNRNSSPLGQLGRPILYDFRLADHPPRTSSCASQNAVCGPRQTHVRNVGLPELTALRPRCSVDFAKKIIMAMISQEIDQN